MAVFKILLAVTALACLADAQRPFYAGLNPIGYPNMQELSNRFGEDDSMAPLEARGPHNKIYRQQVEKLPVDNRPFWYTNSKFYDELRKNPQTYPQRPNSFINK